MSMLTLGDRLYVSAELMPPILYHPKASFATPLAEVLAGSYFHAQHHSRLILTQSYGFNTRDEASDHANVRRARASNTYFSFARGRRTLPEETSHVRVRAVFAALEFHRATLYWRLTVSDGVSSDVATRTSETIPIVADGSNALLSANDLAPLLTSYPFTDGHAIYAEDVEVELANVDAINAAPRVRITLECYGVREYGSAPIDV